MVLLTLNSFFKKGEREREILCVCMCVISFLQIRKHSYPIPFSNRWIFLWNKIFFGSLKYLFFLCIIVFISKIYFTDFGFFCRNMFFFWLSLRKWLSKFLKKYFFFPFLLLLSIKFLF